MNKFLQQANEAALYTLYIYLAHKTKPANNDTLRNIIAGLEDDLRLKKSVGWNGREVYRLSILKKAMKFHDYIGSSKISELTRSANGLTACVFTNPVGNNFVVFRGTGGGEWIDNGEGLSGIAEENTYITYSGGGKIVSRRNITKDYATDQQVEALNWFNRIAAKNSWSTRTPIALCGHSKGGNKAQFIAISTDLADVCYSFDGQGFSPEALLSLRRRHGVKFEARRQNIYSLSTDNDYVNVLGERLMDNSNIYYFESRLGLHFLESILDANGSFNALCKQGELSRYVESVSQKLMKLDPQLRQYATVGVMNIFQKYLGKRNAVNGDSVSIEKTVAGLGVAIGVLLDNL